MLSWDPEQKRTHHISKTISHKKLSKDIFLSTDETQPQHCSPRIIQYHKVPTINCTNQPDEKLSWMTETQPFHPISTNIRVREPQKKGLQSWMPETEPFHHISNNRTRKHQKKGLQSWMPETEPFHHISNSNRAREHQKKSLPYWMPDNEPWHQAAINNRSSNSQKKRLPSWMPETETSHQAATNIRAKEPQKKSLPPWVSQIESLHQIATNNRVRERQKKGLPSWMPETEPSHQAATDLHTEELQKKSLLPWELEIEPSPQIATNIRAREPQKKGLPSWMPETEPSHQTATDLHTEELQKKSLLPWELEIEPSPQIATNIRAREPQKKGLPSWMPETEPSHQAATDLHTEELQKKRLLPCELEIEPSPQIATNIRARETQKKCLPSWMPETEPSHQAATDIHTEDLQKKSQPPCELEIEQSPQIATNIRARETQKKCLPSWMPETEPSHQAATDIHTEDLQKKSQPPCELETEPSPQIATNIRAREPQKKSLSSLMSTTEPSHHIPTKHRMRKSPRFSTECTHDNTMLDDVLNLQETFHKTLSEKHVKVVCVKGNTEGTINYLKKKEKENANVVACIHLELENGGQTVETTKENHHVLEEGNSCVIINVIQEADESAAETTAEHTSRFQPLVITKQGGELVNAWIENYQDVLGKSVAVLRYSTNRSDDELQNLFNHGFGGITRQTRNIRGSSPSGQQWIRGESLVSEILWIISKIKEDLWINIYQGMYGRIIKVFTRRLWRKHPLDNKEKIDDSEQVVVGLETEIKDRKNGQLLLSDRVEIQPQKPCTSTEPYSGKFESKAENVDSAYPPSSPTSISEICSAADETKRVDDYIQRNRMKLSRVVKKRMFRVINRNSEELMKKHSNLNIMSVSPVISHKYGIEERPCIVIYCSDKCKIPPGERKFPSQLDEIPVDIREGSCSLFTAAGPKEHNDPLRTGINIGGMPISDDGTLGPFVVEVENKKTLGFLTCQHVFSSPEIGSSVTQPSVRHCKDSVNPERKCGEIRSMYTAKVLYDGKPTSVDAAYVALSRRKPTLFEFPAIPEPMRTKDFHGNLQMGPPLTQLKDDEEEILVYKLGHASGLTEGVFDSMQEMIKLEEDPEPFRNVIQISSDGKFAEHGDSGAGVFTSSKNILSVIGLLLGGSNSLKLYYVIPIGAALQALEPKLEIHQFRNDDTTGAEGSSVDPPSDGATASPSNTDTGPTVHHTELSKSVTPFSGKKLPNDKTDSLR